MNFLSRPNEWLTRKHGCFRFECHSSAHAAPLFPMAHFLFLTLILLKLYFFFKQIYYQETFFFFLCYCNWIINCSQSQEKTSKPNEKVKTKWVTGSWEGWSFFTICWKWRVNILLIQRFRKDSWKYLWHVHSPGVTSQILLS